MSNKRKPINSMGNLEKKGFISELKEYKDILGKSIWKFNMGQLTFHYNHKKLNVDLSEYCLKIVYQQKNKSLPIIKVWIEHPKPKSGSKHIYSDGSLCLYKPDNFQWKKNMTIEENLFATICTWLYHHEEWKRTGIWHGEEAEH